MVMVTQSVMVMVDAYPHVVGTVVEGNVGNGWDGTSRSVVDGGGPGLIVTTFCSDDVVSEAGVVTVDSGWVRDGELVSTGCTMVVRSMVEDLERGTGCTIVVRSMEGIIVTR